MVSVWGSLVSAEVDRKCVIKLWKTSGAFLHGLHVIVSFDAHQTKLLSVSLHEYAAADMISVLGTRNVA